jgi:Ankyrin repeats (3 copies)
MASVVNRLIKAQLDFAYDGATPLMLAAEQDPTTVRLLVEKGASLSKQDSHGRNAFYRACRASQEEAALILLEAGSDFNTMDKDGFSGIHLSCSKDLLQVTRRLVEKGADLNAKAQNTDSTMTSPGDTCLMLAASGRCRGAQAETRIKLVRYILEQGVPVDDKNENGQTPIFQAYGKVLEPLLEAGADINLRDDWDETALESHLGRSSGGDVGSVVALIEWGSHIPRGIADTYLALTLEDGPEDVEGVAPQPSYLKSVFSCAERLIPPHRRTLWYAMTSSQVVDRVFKPSETGQKPQRKQGYPPLPSVVSAEAAAEGKARRLARLKNDAWRRRRHLCMDRALWRKPAAATEMSAGEGSGTAGGPTVGGKAK